MNGAVESGNEFWVLVTTFKIHRRQSKPGNALPESHQAVGLTRSPIIGSASFSNNLYRYLCPIDSPRLFWRNGDSAAHPSEPRENIAVCAQRNRSSTHQELSYGNRDYSQERSYFGPEESRAPGSNESGSDFVWANRRGGQLLKDMGMKTGSKGSKRIGKTT